jgi:sugar lactone lactonase YvrE
VFVADTGNNRVVRFSPTGQQQKAWGGAGSGEGQFIEPVGIAVGSIAADGSAASDVEVFVADNGNGRLQRFSADGEFLAAFDVPGWRSAAFSEPHVALDDQGLLWVTVPAAGEVRAYDRTGTLKHTVSADEILGGPAQTPLGIAYNPVTHELIVSDAADRVLRLKPADR